MTTALRATLRQRLRCSGDITNRRIIFELVNTTGHASRFVRFAARTGRYTGRTCGEANDDTTVATTERSPCFIMLQVTSSLQALSLSLSPAPLPPSDPR